ncbi:MAG: hypothetical protein QM642_03135 [Edaphocola sp.]
MRRISVLVTSLVFCAMCMTVFFACKKTSEVKDDTTSIPRQAVSTMGSISYYSLNDLIAPPNDSAVLMTFVLRHGGNSACECPDCKCSGCRCPLGMCFCSNGFEVVSPDNVGSITKGEGIGVAWVYKVDNNHVKLIFNQQTALIGTDSVPVSGEPYILDEAQSALLGFGGSRTLIPGLYTADTIAYGYGSIILNVD